MNYKRLLFLILLTSLSSFVLAEQMSEKDIESIEVVSTASQPVVKQSVPVQVMGKEKIEILGLKTLSDAVKTFSGVNVTDYGGLGGMKTVSVRSLGAAHTAVSYDGVVVSNAQGSQIDISNYTLDNVDEISLTIGQGDEIFQTARFFESSGVLNIRSAAPRFIDKRVNVGAQMQLGSFGMYNPTLNIAAKITNRWSVNLYADWMSADGDYPFTLVNNKLVTTEIRNNSDVETLRSEFNIYGNVGKRGGKIYIKGNLLNSERGLPGGVIYYSNKANERLWDKGRFVQAGYNTNFGDKWSLKAFAKYNYAWNKYTDEDKKYQYGYVENRYTQEEYYVSGALRYRPTTKLSFTFAQDIFENKLVTTLDDCPDPYRITSLSSLAGQYRSDRLTLTASLLGLVNHEWALNDTYRIAPNREHLSPAFSLSYQPLRSDDLRVRASVKDGYRVPNFNDLYYSTMGNINLKPESAMQYNVGLTYSGKFLPNILDHTSLSVDCYYNKIDDKIVAIPTTFLWRMLNLGEVEIRGIDINGSTYFSISDLLKFNVSANYTYQNAIDVTNPKDKNYRDQIPYTARHSGNGALTCFTKWFDLGYTATIVGERYCLPQNIPNNLIDRYIDQNISVSRTFEFDKMTLRLRAEMLNMCDVNYDVIKFYPMPGRQYRLSLKLNY